MFRIGLLILAAGASTRLGHPKQLLLYQGQPLIRWVAEVAIASTCQPIGVVLGAYSDQIKPHLADLDLYTYYNAQWATGMASSIHCGLQQMLEITPDLKAILLMVCDQPFVSPPLLHQLMRAYHPSSHPVVACEYAGITGVPALLDRAFFPELFALQGDRGAQAIIRRYSHHCYKIPFADGTVDLDSPADLQRRYRIHVNPTM